MKNKEIVKRLKDSLDYEFDLSFNERKELLSYIEQLENNRDKAIEYIDNYLEREYFDYDILETNTIYNRDLFKVKKILKGDSDESR